MRTTCLLAVPGLVLFVAAPGEPADGPQKAPAPRAIDGRYAPYGSDRDHPWNRLHEALFLRRAPDGSRRMHTTDPLLYRGGTFLLKGETHRGAIAELDQLLTRPGDVENSDPLMRLFLQHDLWAAFDSAAWYPDDWVFKSEYEPAAIALRTRLARAIGKLALDNRALAALPDNYALAVKSKEFPATHDPAHPERPFLPADLFDANGSWVRFHETTARPMAAQHYEGAGGRAAHVIFLRLPGGRRATEQYLEQLRGEPPTPEHTPRPTAKQFPAGTMVAMVRRALTVDASVKVRVTPITELVQLRVYRRIPGDQDVYEFALDRPALFAGRHGLRAVGPDERAEPLFGRGHGDEPFEHDGRTANLPSVEPDGPQLKTCIECHAAPGVDSVLSMERGLRKSQAKVFRTYAWDVELSYTVKAKVKQFDWGLLQGLLEAR